MKKTLERDQFNTLRALGYKGCPDIGDLIEFLEDETNIRHFEYYRVTNTWIIMAILIPVVENNSITQESGELCDTLWTVVREVLETKGKSKWKRKS